MYLAEIRGKLSRDNENKEDILTSNVFSFFKYASRKVFLYPFIRSLGIQINPDDAMEAEFQFWPRFEDGTEPDVVLIIGDYYLLFEAKYRSGFGIETPTHKNQLTREIEEGDYEARNLGKEFRIIALTADYFEKSDIKKEIPIELLSKFKWLNWQSIALSLDQVLERDQNLPPEIRLFADDLYQLLLKKNLRKYEGTKVLSPFEKLMAYDGEIFLNTSTASFRGDFIGFYQALKTEEKAIEIPGEIFFAAKTAVFRGDFFGFYKALSSINLTGNPIVIFYKSQSAPF